MKKTVYNIFFVIFLLSANHSLMAQEPVRVENISTNIQRIDGKEYFFHAVLQGQTLFSIARAYGVSEEDIKAANPELQESGLRFDQMIRIPAKKDTQQTQVQRQETIEYITHQVRRRETVYGISRMYDISQQDLLEHNPEIRSGLRTNMVLRIPRKTQTETHYTFYTVKPQETLFSLSRRFQVSIEDLNHLNPELQEGLKAGQQLRIPIAQTEAPRPPYSLPEKEEKPAISIIEEEIQEEKAICIEPNLKKEYNVALLIPLYLEKFKAEDNKTNLSANHPSFAFLEYYQGIVAAIDSINAMGAHVNLHVFDVCDSLPKLNRILWTPQMAKMDLIIGPFHHNSIERVASFAKERSIPVVTPAVFETPSLLAKHPMLFQALPSIQTQMEDMAQFVAKHHTDANLILVHNNQRAVKDLVQTYKDRLNSELNLLNYYRDSLNLAKIDGYFLNGVYVGERVTNVFVLNDSLLQSLQPSFRDSKNQFEQYMRRNNIQEYIFSENGIEGLKEKMDTLKPNVLISLMGGPALISNYIRELNLQRDTFDITVFGVPQWAGAGYETIEIRHFQNTRTHIFTTDFIDYEMPHNEDFIRRFRKNNSSEPGTMAFKAVQTGMFFFNALHNYGAEFHHCMPQVNEHRPPHSPFWFSQINNGKGGWENQHVFIYRHHNYRLIDAKKEKQQQVVDFK